MPNRVSIDSAKSKYTQEASIGRHVVQTDEPSDRLFEIAHKCQFIACWFCKSKVARGRSDLANRQPDNRLAKPCQMTEREFPGAIVGKSGVPDRRTLAVNPAYVVFSERIVRIRLRRRSSRWV
jgi:hypothetical protein